MVAFQEREVEAVIADSAAIEEVWVVAFREMEVEAEMAVVED